ncbi:hypothetical protein STEG23_015568, partial [Scotinomys teguina]
FSHHDLDAVLIESLFSLFDWTPGVWPDVWLCISASASISYRIKLGYSPIRLMGVIYWSLFGYSLLASFSRAVGCSLIVLCFTSSIHLRVLAIMNNAAMNMVEHVSLWKWFPVPMLSRVLPTFSSITFSVTGFMLRSLTNIENIILSEVTQTQNDKHVQLNCKCECGLPIGTYAYNQLQDV